jgi:hypothetical protein
MAQLAQSASFGSLTGPGRPLAPQHRACLVDGMANTPIAKLGAVKKLLDKLTEDLKSASLQPQGRFQ